jgi:uncharacterized Ntn-hydrolase superfamily protein
MRNSAQRFIALAAAVSLLATPALATWSILLADRDTGEMAIGSATCIQNINLKKTLAVIRPGYGVAAAQALIDSSGMNRLRIWNELESQTDPNAILALLAAGDSNHQSRQYGIVDIRGRVATFSGAANGAYANNIQGRIGSLTYSIQGNVITGQPVLDMALAAIENTPGGIPEKFMAAMEAAYLMGGDGRCSCGPQADACGSPPPSFTKSAHVGFMVVVRRGDESRATCEPGTSCARGVYYMDLNVSGRDTDPDPVLTLREMFDQWRIDLAGVPDAIESHVSVTPERAFNDGETATLRIELRDWQGLLATEIQSVAVEHDPQGSAGSSALGPLTDLGGGVYTVELTPGGAAAGVDRFMITVTNADGTSEILLPAPILRVQDVRADLNFDGAVDLLDLEIVLKSFGLSAAGDTDDDDDTDLLDLATVLNSFADAAG